MDNDMLGKLGRGFLNDGIFGVVRAAFGIDEPSAASAAVADDRDCRRLVIDDSGARGLKIDEYWLYPFRQAQSFTMARERPTLSDLASMCGINSYHYSYYDECRFLAFHDLAY